jgi:hypothetical protein
MKVLRDEVVEAAIRSLEPSPTQLVFAPARPSCWEHVERELLLAFELTRTMASRPGVIVYLLRSEAMLGLADPLDACLCGALVGASRALSLEGRRAGLRSHALGYCTEEEQELASWLQCLFSGAATGQVVHVGGAALGKVPL